MRPKCRRTISIACEDSPRGLRLCAEAGATAYYTKPFSPMALLKEIDRLKAGAAKAAT